MAWRRGRSSDLSRQMCFYLDGFEEVQVVEEVLLCMVQPDARGLTEDFLYQQCYLLVRDGHKLLQTAPATLPGTHVPQVDGVTSKQDLIGRQETGSVAAV